MRRASRQLGASPVLIGAVTVLVAIVAVFISYSANTGLPFVPSYQLKAEVPNGAKLVKGNEVRAGGFRVGIVEDIRSVRRQVDGEERAIAMLDLKLDKQVEPLSVDSTLSVRPRSALGLKYVELIPGRARRTFQDGDTIPLRNTGEGSPELEDVLSTFEPETRDDARKLARGLRELDRGARAGHQHRDPRARAVHALPAPGDEEPLRSGHRAAQPLPGPGRGGRRGGARGGAPGALVRRDGDHLRGDVARPRGAPPDDRGEPGDAGRRHRVVPGADALPRALRGGVARPPAGRRAAPAHAAARERRPPGRGAGVPADPGTR